eukprot:g334.t1
MEKLTSLLEVISKDMYVFSSSRDFSILPPIITCSSPKALFASVDLVYNALYHPLRGEARIGSKAPGNLPNLCSILTTLFLHAHLEKSDEAPSKDNPYVCSTFETEIGKALRDIESNSIRAKFQSEMRNLKQDIFDDSAHLGVLSWSPSIPEHIWKRSSNQLRHRWIPNLTLFINARNKIDSLKEEENAHTVSDIKSCAKSSSHIHDNEEKEASGERSKVDEAIRNFITVVDSTGPCCDNLDALIEVQIDRKNGKILRVRTATHVEAIRWLVLQMLKRSINNPLAADAVAKFSGRKLIPDTPEGRLSLVFPVIQKAMQVWTKEGSLPNRHKKFSVIFNKIQPSIATLVEFDEQWRCLGLPTKCRHRYALLKGRGSANVVYAKDEYKLVIEKPGKMEEQIWEEVTSRCVRGNWGPKNSCVALLERICDGTLVLVTAVHCDSAPASRTRRVRLRALQTDTTLSDLSNRVSLLSASGAKKVVVIVG